MTHAHTSTVRRGGAAAIIATALVLVLVIALGGCVRRGAPAPVVMASPAHQQAANAATNIGLAERPDSIIVQPGETLYAVSRRYAVPLRPLIEANNLRPPFGLVSGQRLMLPQVRTYTVQPGDTLLGLSRRFGVDASTLARTNEIEPPYPVKLGQVLILPPPVQTAAAPAAPNAVPTGAPAAVTAEPLAPPAPVMQSAQNPPQVPPSSLQPPPQASVPTSPPPQAVASAVPVPSAPPPEPPAEPLHAARNFAWPVRGPVLVGYGPGANGTQNDGINIAAPLGTPVLAAGDGVVAYAGNELRGFGNLILLKHADGWTTAYAHCESISVKRGDHVRRGQPIARVGATGAVSEPQLHFELRRGTRALDPQSYLPPVSTAAAGSALAHGALP